MRPKIRSSCIFFLSNEVTNLNINHERRAPVTYFDTTVEASRQQLHYNRYHDPKTININLTPSRKKCFSYLPFAKKKKSWRLPFVSANSYGPRRVVRYIIYSAWVSRPAFTMHLSWRRVDCCGRAYEGWAKRDFGKSPSPPFALLIWPPSCWRVSSPFDDTLFPIYLQFATTVKHYRKNSMRGASPPNPHHPSLAVVGTSLE